jgi:CubicO group peptidase (beta-lactamase class C family)
MNEPQFAERIRENRAMLLGSLHANDDAEPTLSFSGIWWEYPHPSEVLLPGPDGDRRRKALKAEGYRSAMHTAWGSGGKTDIKKAFVMIQDGLRYYGENNRTLAHMLDRDRKLRKRGFKLSWIALQDWSPYPFNCIWERTDVEVTYQLDDGFESFNRALLANRGRLVRADCRGPADESRWAGFWHDEGEETLALHGLSADAHQAGAENLVRDGFRPVSLMEFGGGEEPRAFTSGWVRSAPRRWRASGDGPALARCDALLKTFMKEHAVSRAALGVTVRERLVGLQGYTWLPSTAPTTDRRSRFRLGPLSCAITALTVLRLAERGRLQLDQPLSALLPQLESELGAATANALLSEWSGGLDALWAPPDPARAYWAFDHIAWRAGRPRNLSDVLRAAQAASSVKADGPAELGALVLGLAVGTSGGESYEAVTRRDILTPLHARSFALGRAGLWERLPDEVGYDGAGRSFDATGTARVVPTQYGGYPLELLAPARGWIASAADLARIGAALADPERCSLLSPAGAERFWSILRSPVRMPGTTAHLERLEGDLTLTLLLNKSVDVSSLLPQLRAALLATQVWPEEDLFGR